MSDVCSSDLSQYRNDADRRCGPGRAQGFASIRYRTHVERPPERSLRSKLDQETKLLKKKSRFGCITLSFISKQQHQTMNINNKARILLLGVAFLAAVPVSPGPHLTRLKQDRTSIV